MSRGINEIQVIDLSVSGLVIQGRCLGLDGDAPFPFQIHGIEHLRLHFTIRQTTAQLDDPVGERRFAMVDMSDNGKITDVFH